MLLSDDVAARTLENIMFKDDEIYTVFVVTKSGDKNEGKRMFWTMMEQNDKHYKYMDVIVKVIMLVLNLLLTIILRCVHQENNFHLVMKDMLH